MADEAQEVGKGDADADARQAVLEAVGEQGAQAQHAKGKQVVKEDDGYRRQGIGGVAYIFKTQHQLQQSVDNAGEDAPFGAVAVGDQDQHQGAAEGDGAAHHPGGGHREELQG